MKATSFALVLLAVCCLFILGCQDQQTTAPTSNNTTTVAQLAKGGFDQFGYNYQARLFNGTGNSWAAAKGLPLGTMGIYGPDHLIMKWNAEWDRGNAENWLYPPYGAWEDNEWNGAFPGGSGAVWHYKIIWVGAENSTYWRTGGYLIWGQFEVIMDQGHDPNLGIGHIWFTHANPTGYGH